MKQLLQAAFMKQKINQIEHYLTNVLSFDNLLLNTELNKILKSGGKRLRPALLLLVGEYFKNDKHDIIVTASMMELIHMASLIHDDVNDKADIRRGSKTINSLYGDDIAVHMGDFLLMETLLQSFNVKQTQLILSTLAYLAIEMSKGEFAQINSFFDISQNKEDYYYRIERKTAFLIAESCKLGALLSNGSPDEVLAFYKYGYHIGLAFQIKDDLMDLDEASVLKLGKPVGNDLKQGLLNLPLLLVLETEFPEKEKVCKIVQEKLPNGEKDISFIKEIIVKYGGIEKSNEILDQHIDLAKQALKSLNDNQILNYFYDGADYIKMRKI